MSKSKSESWFSVFFFTIVNLILGILKRLCKNNNIVILQPDKGDGTVIMDRAVYIRKIFEIIKDWTKLKE